MKSMSNIQPVGTVSIHIHTLTKLIVIVLATKTLLILIESNRLPIPCVSQETAPKLLIQTQIKIKNLRSFAQAKQFKEQNSTDKNELLMCRVLILGVCTWSRRWTRTESWWTCGRVESWPSRSPPLVPFVNESYSTSIFLAHSYITTNFSGEILRDGRVEQIYDTFWSCYD